MENSASEAPEIELTPENWIEQFGEDAKIETPIGEVKVGENQYFKLAQQGRDGKLGMIKLTLVNPDVIIEDYRPDVNGNSERDTSYIFIRTFVKSDGSRYYYFSSVTVLKDGKEVVISSQEKGYNKISRLLQNGNVVLIKDFNSLHPKAQIEESIPLNDSNELTNVNNQSALLGINSSVDDSYHKDNNNQTNSNELDENNSSKSTETIETKGDSEISEQSRMVRGVLEQMGFSEVTVIDNVSQIPESEQAAIDAINQGRTVKGWFDPSTGKSFIYTPNATTIEDIKETLWHEVVAHHGMRELFGKEGYNKLLDKVWDSMSLDAKAEMFAYIAAGRRELEDTRENRRAAADEYVARIAEGGVDDATVWDKIKKFVQEFANKLGLNVDVTDADIQALLRASYSNLHSKGATQSIKRKSNNDTRFRNAKTIEEFDVIQREAVDKKGIVAPNLNSARVEIVDAPEHGFRNFAEAKAWAKSNIAKTYSDAETGGKGEVRISNTAIDKFLSNSAIQKSDSKDIHQRVIKVLPGVIRTSIEAEIHPDYNKINGVRDVKNDYNKDVLIHRLYGAVNIDGEIYRIKVTLKENSTLNTPQNTYSYEATKIELLAGQSGDTEQNLTSPRYSNNSISVAKLLKGVDKSYDKGKKLLDESEEVRFRITEEEQRIIDNAGDNAFKAPNGKPTKLTHKQWAQVRTKAFKEWFGDWEKDTENSSKVVDENGEPLVVYHRSNASFNQFDKNKHEKHTDLVSNKLHRPLGYDFSIGDNIYNNRPYEYQCYLNVKNLFDGENASEKELDKLQKIVSKTYYAMQNPNFVDDFMNRVKLNEWGAIEMSEVERYIAKNYDGARINERGFQGLKVFQPNQIKSATDNNGEFSVENGDIYFREDVNEKFNKQLSTLTEENADSVILDLGHPSDVLLSAGIPNRTIALNGNKVLKKAKAHGFEVSNLRDLPLNINNPIVIFKGSYSGSYAILTELEIGDKKTIVSIDINKAEVQDFNLVTSVYGKNGKGVLSWINEGKSIYINKEKALNYLSSSAPIADATNSQGLFSATKIVENFVNPTLPSDNITNERGSTSATTAALTRADIRKMEQHAKSQVERLNLDNMEILTSTEGLEGKKRKAKGFYTKSTGKITIVVPNNRSVEDIEQTILHEAVAHHGLRKLFGGHFEEFLDKVYANVDLEVRKKITDLAAKNDWDFRKATEEYLATLAESTNFESAKNEGWWQTIKDLFNEMLRKLDFSGGISDNELRYILWKSYENLKDGGKNDLFSMAADVAMQDNLKVGEYAVEQISDNTLFRDGDPEAREKTYARDRYEERVATGWYQSQESLQDSMLGLKEAMLAIAGKDKHIEDIAGFENAYLGENRLSRKNQQEAMNIDVIL